MRACKGQGRALWSTASREEKAVALPPEDPPEQLPSGLVAAGVRRITGRTAEKRAINYAIVKGVLLDGISADRAGRGLSQRKETPTCLPARSTGSSGSQQGRWRAGIRGRWPPSTTGQVDVSMTLSVLRESVSKQSPIVIRCILPSHPWIRPTGSRRSAIWIVHDSPRLLGR